MPVENLGHFSPAEASSLEGLLATFIAVGSLDLFLEENLAYALRLSRAGVPVEAHVYPGAIHGFEMFSGDITDAFNSAFAAAMRRALNR